jgi:hypothetical protein
MIHREYQERGIAAVSVLFAQGRRRVCYPVTAGSGKTILFVHAAREALSIARVSGVDRLRRSEGVSVPVVVGTCVSIGEFPAISVKANREVMSG